MISEFVVIILSLVIGYYIGRYNLPQPEVIGYRVKKFGKIITGKAKSTVGGQSSGIIYRPTAEKLNKDKRIKEHQGEHDAMVETLDSIPELKKLREKMGNESK